LSTDVKEDWFPPPFSFPKLADYNLQTLSSLLSPFMLLSESRLTNIEKTANGGDQMRVTESMQNLHGPWSQNQRQKEV